MRVNIPKTVRRAAFDIGSARIKVQVADVDVKMNKIAKVVFADLMIVPLSEDLAKSLEGRFSSEIQNDAISALSKLLEKIAPFRPTAYHGIATEAFRVAGNCQEFIQKIHSETGLVVTMISERTEGILGNITAISESNIQMRNAVSWDFGGGAFKLPLKTLGSTRSIRKSWERCPF